jgi:hypothetical protein
MKQILFNTQMVRAILDGKKTQTRRVNKDGSEYSAPDMSFFDPESRTYAIRNYADREHQQQTSLVQAPVPICPGDILWVRETWAENPCLWEKTKYIYRADSHLADEAEQKWRPSIHMPREAARIFMRVMDVRVERLQEMTEDDAFAEGLDYNPPCMELIPQGYQEPPVTCYVSSDIQCPADPPCNHSFPERFGSEIWNKTIKPAELGRYGWDANPWVWVIDFERYYPADLEEEETT